MFMGLLMLDTT